MATSERMGDGAPNESGRKVGHGAVLTTKQAEVLRDVARGGYDALDPLDFIDAGPLWWRNRERVIDALQRKGLLDGEQVTEKGLAVLTSLAGAAS